MSTLVCADCVHIHSVEDGFTCGAKQQYDMCTLSLSTHQAWLASSLCTSCKPLQQELSSAMLSRKSCRTKHVKVRCCSRKRMLTALMPSTKSRCWHWLECQAMTLSSLENSEACASIASSHKTCSDITVVMRFVLDQQNIWSNWGGLGGASLHMFQVQTYTCWTST